MLNLKKHQNISTYQKTPFVHGLIQEKSNISQPKEVIGDISSNQQNLISLNAPKKELTSSTLVFLLENKKMTLTDNLNISKPNTPTTPLSPTLDLESTLKDQDLKGFWRESSKEISKKLWLPTETALADLDTHYLNGFSNTTTQNSFVIQNQKSPDSKNSQMTSWLSLLSSQLDTMEKENTTEQYCRKVRFYPTTKHKNLLEKCFGATRFLINQALENIKTGKITKITNAISIRNELKYQDKYLNANNKWLEEIPYDTRDGAIRQLCSNFKSALTHLKQKLITKFSMKFKSKKNPKQVCFLNKNALNIKNKTLFVRRIKDKIKFGENIDNYDYGTLTIVREKNRYYMCFPLTRTIKNISTKYKSVSLDPGVKTFQSFYSEEGVVGKLGDNTYKHIKSIYEKEDNLKSKLDTKNMKKKTRYNIRKRCFLLRTKVKNTVKDLHIKCCSWLTSNFKYIFLPEFNVKNMIKKKNRNIGKQTVRSMLSLSHFSFKQRLLFMAKSRGCKVDICNEAYTSKTCGCCGVLNCSLGGNRMFTCKNCNSVIDRDYNGARNIYLKNIQ